MKRTRDVQQGTLALMVLKTLDVLGPLHGFWDPKLLAFCFPYLVRLLLKTPDLPNSCAHFRATVFIFFNDR